MTESQLPVRYRKLGLWPDSGGAGRYRGGLGYEVELDWLGGEGTVSLRRERHKFGPWGLEGGGAAPVCRTEMAHGSGVVEPLPGKILAPIERGEQLRYWTTGGGGYGSPFTREPAQVLADVLDGRVSLEAARETYGVVIESGLVDTAKTAALRGRQNESGEQQ